MIGIHAIVGMSHSAFGSLSFGPWQSSSDAHSTQKFGGSGGLKSIQPSSSPKSSSPNVCAFLINPGGPKPPPKSLGAGPKLPPGGPNPPPGGPNPPPGGPNPPPGGPNPPPKSPGGGPKPPPGGPKPPPKSPGGGPKPP